MDILVLNESFEVIKNIDTYESLIWNDKYNEYGDFELYLTMNIEYLEYLKINNYLQIDKSDRTMIIDDIKITTDIEDGNKLIVSGKSLESILTRRIVWGQKVLQTNLQEGIKVLLYENIIAPTLVDRKISNFKFIQSSDSRITSININVQYTGDDIYSIIKSLCQTYNIGFKVILSNNNEFEFSLFKGEDRSYMQNVNPYVVFSPKNDNILNTNFILSSSEYKNVCLVGGEGQGSSRKTAIVGTEKGLNRRELFVDASDISSYTSGGTLPAATYTAQLQARGIETLYDYSISTGFDGTAEASELYVYGKDFFIGDIIQTEDEYGNEGQSYISEIITSQSREGLFIYPTFKTIGG